MGHLVTENRNGLAIVAQLSDATGTAERDSPLEMMTNLPGTQRIALAADKNYDTRDFVDNLRELRVTPHVAQNDTNRRSAIDLSLIHI